MLTRAVRTVWIVGFLIGTASHVGDLVHAGVDVYREFPQGVRLYWVSLTALDPLVATLVLLRQRAGVALGAAVMVSDVAVNAWVYATTAGLDLAPVLRQAIFGVVVVTTSPWLWRASRTP